MFAGVASTFIFSQIPASSILAVQIRCGVKAAMGGSVGVLTCMYSGLASQHPLITLLGTAALLSPFIYALLVTTGHNPLQERAEDEKEV